MKNKGMSDIELVIILMVILLIVIFLVNLIGLVSAYPYQLNLTDGTIIDLNSSNNATNNFTIYIVWQNVSYYNVTNVTNITYVNMTCLNCSNYYNNTNISNDTYYSYAYGYNKSDIDGSFVPLADFNSYKSGLNFATKDELNNLNSTITKPAEVQTTWLWLSVLGLFLIEVGLIGYAIWLSRGGE